ncbi:ADP-ribosyltransferase [Bacillus thuringiensis]|uniref:ADP-ribosyltransferase n=1 Tax=Bacillus thuringiensis TaxID=1428 RepID=UPI00119DA8A2
MRIEFKVLARLYGAYIALIPNFPNEKEVLLPRGAKFKVTAPSTIEEHRNIILIICADVVS